jgi:hypothetical protein
MSYIGNQPTSVAFLTDQFSGTGSQTAFTLSAAPANTASIIVAVSGVLQDPSTYSTAGLTLTFSAAPPSGTGNISVRFLGIPASNITTTAYRTATEFTATAGQTTFSVPSYTVGYIDVYRNGALLGSADYTATNGTTVVLANAASSGDLIETISFFVSSVLNAIPAVAGAVTETYINTGAVTQAKLGAGVAGNGPAVFAFNTSTQSIGNATFVKAVLNSELFDTANCFDTSNYRFTPNVAGYYQISFSSQVDFIGGSGARGIISLYKNGSQFIFVEMANNANASTYPSFTLNNVLVYANGSTDFFEIYYYQTTGGAKTAYGGAPYATYFSSSLVRAA